MKYEIRQNESIIAGILDKNELNIDEITTLRQIKFKETTTQLKIAEKNIM